MSPAAFLLIAIGVSLVGSVIVLLRAREPKRTMQDSISGFRRELAALSPERSPDADVRETSRLLVTQLDEEPLVGEHRDEPAGPPRVRRGAPEALWRPDPSDGNDASDYFGPLYRDEQEPG